MRTSWTIGITPGGFATEADLRGGTTRRKTVLRDPSLRDDILDLPELWPTIRQNDRGPDVLRLQRMLNQWAAGAHRLMLPLQQDSSFGPATKARLFFFQTVRKLETDAICGSTTWVDLTKAIAEIAAKEEATHGSA